VRVLIANELDLVYTYVGAARGAFWEANPWLGPLLYTWWPIGVKAGSLALLAVGVALAARQAPARQERVRMALRLVATVYAAVLALHLIALTAGSRG
jgi:hypothetical protein